MARNNPSTPAILGNEWNPVNVEQVTLNKDFEVGTVVVSTATETITGGNVVFFNDGLDFPNQYRFHIVEHVYPTGSELSTGKIRQVNVPVSSGALVGTAFLTNAATVADALTTHGLFNNVGFLPNSLPTDGVEIRFNTTNTLSSTDRILKVAFRYVLWSELPQETPTYPDRPFPIGSLFLRQNDASNIVLMGMIRGDFVTGQQTLGYTRIVSLGEVNPLTATGAGSAFTSVDRFPWTRFQFQRFGDAGANGIFVRFTPETDQSQNSYLSFFQMIVTVCTENRVGLGGRVFADSGGVGGTSSEIAITNNYKVFNPSNTIGWAKQSGVDYLVTQHLGDTGDGWFLPDPVLYFDGSSEHIDVGQPPSISMPDSIVPFDPHVGYTLLRDANNVPTLSETTSRIPPTTALLNGTNNNDVRWTFFTPSAKFDIVASGNPGQNELVRQLSGGSVAYPYVRLYLQPIGTPTADFVVTVSSTGETATLTPDEANELPIVANGWRLATLEFDTPPVFDNSATNRTLTMTSNTLLTDPWWVLAGTLSGSQDRQSGTLTLQILADIQPVTGVGLSAEVQPITGWGANCVDPPECIPIGIDYVDVTWSPLTTVVSGSASPIVTGFAHYEIQRIDDIDLEWRTIALISSITVTGFADFECRYEIPTSYRIRACRQDEISSSWTQVGPITLAVDHDVSPRGTLTYTSNYDPSLNLAYVDVYPDAIDESFAFVEAEQQTLQAFYNRDYQTAFRPLERGGVSFTRTMLVNKIASATLTMDRGFNPIRDLAWAPLPYVCVRDQLGNRWFANLLVPSGSITHLRQIYLTTVTITEVTNVPAPADVCED